MLDYSDYLVFIHPLLKSVFISSIPESFLPNDKDTIQDALNYMGKYYFDMGDIKTSDACGNCIGTLTYYEEDDKALEGLKNIYDSPKMREFVAEQIKKYKANNLPAFLKAIHPDKVKDDN